MTRQHTNDTKDGAAPVGRTELINKLLNAMRPRTKAPAARFNIAVQLGLAAGLFHAGRRDDAKRILEAVQGDARTAGVKRQVDAILATLA